jgi:acyl transferase domain-containing protein
MSMRDIVEGQAKTGFNTGKACKQNLCVGANTAVGVGAYIALSGPGMLTHKGRCFTFDRSADGYARAEGVGGMTLKKCENEIDSMGRLAMLIGACVNQDGRSASMTAPHGPSQQEVIRACMTEAGLDASMVTIAECHGTGTSLGDPIEIGSLRGTMKAGRGEKALLCTSSKSNVGHMEAGAGMLGTIKCILILRASTGTPNLHLYSFNPHLDIEGFPLWMQTEHTDFMANSGLTGVSSFGFGGTNARADMWGHCTQGPRAAVTGTSMRPRSLYD